MLQRKNAGKAWLVGLISLVLSVTACTAAVPPTPAQSAQDSVAIDELATINVSPVDYDGVRVVTAVFSEIVEGRGGPGVGLTHQARLYGELPAASPRKARCPAAAAA